MLDQSTVILLLSGLLETIYMTLVSGCLGFIIGLPLGITLFLTRKGKPMENTLCNQFLSFIINAFRAVPFIILIVWLVPLTRALAGTSIGVNAAIIPLSIGAAPFIVENSLLEVSSGLIEAAKALGAGPAQIVFKVLLPEALPSLINNASITLITLVGYSAMGGALGAGGLGQIGYQYGYVGYNASIMNAVLLLLVGLVFTIQITADKISKKITHR
jgi:D-methionine transport system permease protein